MALMRYRLLRVLFVLSGIASPAGAQRSGIAGPALSRLDVSAVVKDTVIRQHATYGWREPALISGAILGGLSGLVSVAFCGDRDSNNNTPLDQCPAQDGVAVLIGAAVGGTVAAVLTASPTAPRVPAGYEAHGNRGGYGALMLGIPTAGIFALAMGRPCHSFTTSTGTSGCSVGSIAGGLAMVAVNAGVGYLVAKGLPAIRRTSVAP